MASTLQSQLEHLQSKYHGTGNADTTKYEWATNMKRDSNASYIGHDALLTYFSVGLNESKERLRLKFLDNMIQPCGPKPEGEDDSE
eukprot:CAMPEP_0168592860 /NCGR_PEP_ID=MMETSP0420-20121227/7976_1 /TAXON_ID=498008 /ORGANISM="Pessonella sp." /LENGTH=85 /DNA_ID=CAMNT_0008628913 /DNA_START=1 /DNA_END=258 /DNA_ORIENTATION=-